MALQVQCRAIRPDGGAASGLLVRCTDTDAGAVTDGTGSFSFMASMRTCGIAGGSVDCGSVRLIEDGGALVISASGDSQVYSSTLKGGSCQLIAR